ncbi:MAG: PAS domain S-box protein [Burkholderiales bacterium]|nr:PAS domain S-box protein [Burkholderiales bacterium]
MLRLTWPQVAMVIVLLVMSGACVWLLTAARAYVSAEAVVSKAHRNAIAQLARYADSGDSVFYAAYEAEILVPIEAARARRELEKDQPNYFTARRALHAARVAPEDITEIIVMFRLLQRQKNFSTAVALWAQSDAPRDRIQEAAQQLRVAYERGARPDSAAVLEARREVAESAARIEPLSEGFSGAISRTARDAAYMLFASQIVLALVLILLGVQLSRTVLSRGRQVERSLRELSQRLELATRGSSDGFWDWDFNRRLLFHSDHLRELMGWPRATGPRRAPEMWRMLHPRDAARFRRALRLHLAGRAASLNVEVRLRTGVASYRWFHVRGRILEQDGRAPQRLSGALTDIHTRVEAQAALRASEALLRGVFEAANDVVIVVDEQDMIQFANRAVETIFGVPVSEAIGANVTLLQPGPSTLGATWVFERPLPGHAAVPRWRRMSSTGRRRNGEEFPVEISFSEVYIDNRRLFAVFLRDMSPWRQVQQEVAQARQLLDSTQLRFEHVLVTELEAQQTHIAQELHDSLGSELAALSLVLGGTRALAGGAPQLAGQIDLALAQVQSAVEVTRALARGLMPVSDHPGAFWRAMERLASDFSRGRGASCEFATQGDVEAVSSETGSHLYRIAQEALANAVRHGRASHLEIVLSRRSARLRLSICDNGSGFSAASLSGEDAGVGMRSMLARARAIGGRIQFLRRPAGGAEVRVEWPAPPRGAPMEVPERH